MKKVLVASLSMMLVLAASLCWGAELKKYVAPDGKFSISFPGDPEVNKMESGIGKRNHNVTLMLEGKDGDLSFMVMTMDYDGRLDDSHLEQFMERDGEYVDKNSVSLADFEGHKSIYFEEASPAKNDNKAIFIAMQFVMVDNREYALTFSEYGRLGLTDAEQKAKKEFFSSFHIN
jgi:hypothetical protein